MATVGALTMNPHQPRDSTPTPSHAIVRVVGPRWGICMQRACSHRGARARVSPSGSPVGRWPKPASVQDASLDGVDGYLDEEETFRLGVDGYLDEEEARCRRGGCLPRRGSRLGRRGRQVGRRDARVPRRGGRLPRRGSQLGRRGRQLGRRAGRLPRRGRQPAGRERHIPRRQGGLLKRVRRWSRRRRAPGARGRQPL
jgi:hypothetical protein